MKKVNIIQQKTVYNGFFKLNEIGLTFEKSDGSMSEPVSRLVFERGHAVSAVVWHANRQKTVLVKQFRLPSHLHGQGWLLELPAGILERGEDQEEAVARELEEEIGFSPLRMEKIAEFYTSPGGSTEKIFLYYAEISDESQESDGGGLESEQEDIELLWFSLDEIRQMMAQNSIQDAKTLIGMQWLLQRK